eukprot:5972600-Prymnesium_polylepis.2
MGRLLHLCCAPPTSSTEIVCCLHSSLASVCKYANDCNKTRVRLPVRQTSRHTIGVPLQLEPDPLSSPLTRGLLASRWWIRWEVVALLQRTILSGWLLLVDGELRFLRLLAGLVVAVSFLVLLLVCAPYKSKFDHGTAAGAQVLLVGIFMGGLVVRLYEDIFSDTLGSRELAYRFLGLHSSDDAVVMMIVVALSMLCLLILSLTADTYMHIVQQRLMQKWAVCTMDPPYIVWKTQGVYACFLSHYKIEAASDARCALLALELGLVIAEIIDPFTKHPELLRHRHARHSSQDAQSSCVPRCESSLAHSNLELPIPEKH